jgi:hypothetical protein
MLPRSKDADVALALRSPAGRAVTLVHRGAPDRVCNTGSPRVIPPGGSGGKRRAELRRHPRSQAASARRSPDCTAQITVPPRTYPAAPEQATTAFNEGEGMSDWTSLRSLLLDQRELALTGTNRTGHAVALRRLAAIRHAGTEMSHDRHPRHLTARPMPHALTCGLVTSKNAARHAQQRQ